MVKPWFFLVLVGGVLGLSSCTPALQDAVANSLNQSSQQAAVNRQLQARQDAIDNNPPVIGVKCAARDGQIRLNQLRQGLNACFFSALISPQLGEIVRMDAVILRRFTTKQDIRYQESYEAQDNAWRGQRIGYILPIVLPDSLTGALVQTLAGAGKVAFSQLLQARLEFFGGALAIGLPKLDAKAAQYFDPEGNFNDAGNRWSNLGERPYQVLIQLKACAADGVCALSPVTELATR